MIKGNNVCEYMPQIAKYENVDDDDDDFHWVFKNSSLKLLVDLAANSLFNGNCSKI